MAITQTLASPGIYSPAFNPIAWSFLSDKSEEQDMKYVIDIYVYGATGYTHRIKQRPNPAGWCIIDVSAIVQPYISLAGFQNEYGYLQNKPWRANNNEVFFTGAQSEIFTYIDVKAGEEYTVNGTPVIFDGLGATGEPAYILGNSDYVNGTGVTAPEVRILPSALTINQALINQSAQGISEFWTKYYTLASSGFTNPLTVNPGYNYVMDGDFHTLTWLNWGDYGSGYDQVLYGARIKYYDSGDNEIGAANIINIQSEGGGPQTSAAYTTATYDPDYTMLSLKCGPASMGVALGSLGNYNACSYYEVLPLIKITTGGTLWEGPTTRFVKSTDCQNLYPRIRLSWLNELGGRDYYNFTKFYEKTTNTQSQYWSQSVLDYSYKYPYGGENTSTINNFGGVWLRGGEQSVNRTTTTTYRIQSDWVKQEEMNFLGTIPESSQVWAYLDQSNQASAGSLQPVTVKITNLNYSYKLIKQVKLAQVSFDMTYTKIDQKQNIS